MPETPITTTTVLRWGTFAATIITAIVAMVWQISSIKTDAVQLRTEFVAHEANDTAVNDRIKRVEAREDSAEKSISDMERKLDVAVALLQRIDSKVGKP